MKRVLLIALTYLSLALPCFSTTLQAGVSYDVPSEFYGTWRVYSNLIKTNSPADFNNSSSDIWVLSLNNNVISLSNPATGAFAQLNIESVNKNTITFKKKGSFGANTSKSFQQLFDVVKLNLDGDIFVAENELVLETFSKTDGSKISTKTATYQLFGEKISGKSVLNRN